MLPRAQPDETFTRTTVEMVALSAAADVEHLKLQADRRRRAMLLATLGRRPTEAERSILVKRITAATDRRRAVEDALHALVNHPEFLFQH